MSARNPSRRMRFPAARTRGSSLVEALLASALLVVVAVPIFAMLESTSRFFGRGDAASTLQNDLRPSMAQMVRELRMAGYDPSATGCAAFFEVAGPTTVRFLADADIIGTTERIEYTYHPPKPNDPLARTITRQVWLWVGPTCTDWGPADAALVVARDVDSLTFTYFDANDDPPAGLADIRRVTVAAAGSRMVGGYGLERFTVSSDARARNLL